MIYLKATGFMLIIVGLFYGRLSAQEKERLERDTEIQTMIEELAETYEADLDYTDLIESLTRMAQHPLNINKASREELQKLPFLNDIQIVNLLDYREEYGDLLSLYEMVMITGFNRQFLEKIRYFIQFEPVSTLPSLNVKNALQYGNNDLFIRYQRTLEDQSGYAKPQDSLNTENANRHYLGNPGKYYIRYSYDYFDKMRIGFVAEKDPGEYFSGSFPSFADSIRPAKGFDFYSGNITVYGLGPVSQLTLGDYNLAFGQGLTLWSGLSFGKSPSRIYLKKYARKIKPSTSANENLFMRGMASSIEYKNLSFTGFYSNRQVDANLEIMETPEGTSKGITSLPSSGYHRTLNELAGKDAVKQLIYGGNLGYTLKRFRINLTAYHSRLQTKRIAEPALYEKFHNYNQNRKHLGFSAEYIWKNLSLFSEITTGEKSRPAFLGGLYAYLHPQLEVSLMYRNYPREYDNSFSNAFGENTSNANEEGIFFGVQSQLSRRWEITAYADHFRFPWLKYRVDAPGTGKEYSLQLAYNPNRNIETYLRYRYEDKLQNTGLEVNMDFPLNVIRESLRLNLHYPLNTSFSITHRLEYSSWHKVQESESTGFLLLNDLLYRPENKPFDLSLRYALFDSDDYNSRLYAYEHDVLYAFSIPSYYYKGSRFYILVKYEINRNLDLWSRFSQTYYSNQKEIGSGLNVIDGNRKSEVKVQLRMRF